jgi:16S rRNA C967 or C1407 C5-methylase (RsmB/RsmF family)/NOL1/NOP2/fmu family ribosome biogenesis protein
LKTQHPRPTLPADFCRRIENDWMGGPELILSLDEVSPISIRLHKLKSSTSFEQEKSVPWTDLGRYLEERPSFTLDPLFHAGAYYPQEAGSMFVDWIVNQLAVPEAPIFLDLCAAPGGKSTILLDFLQGKGILVSNEIIRSRSYILRDNISKWGYSNCIVTNNSVEDFGNFASTFDCILVDAPCSGEGMFRKDPNAREEWSVENVRTCEVRQQNILSHCADLVKDGGYIIYSTCTFNRGENELQLQDFMEHNAFEIVRLQVDESWGLSEDSLGLGFYALPSKMQTEGFYFAVLKKVEGQVREVSKKKGRDKKKKSKEVVLQSTVQLPSPQFKTYDQIEKNDFVFAFPSGQSSLAKEFLNSLTIIKWGLRLGAMMKNKLVPDHELAMNIALNEGFERVELSKTDALRYLKGETFSIDAPQGWVIITYQNLPLGWIKSMGNRFNNYYPKELRIRMELPGVK